MCEMVVSELSSQVRPSEHASSLLVLQSDLVDIMQWLERGTRETCKERVRKGFALYPVGGVTGLMGFVEASKVEHAQLARYNWRAWTGVEVLSRAVCELWQLMLR